ncbi:MAG TPA: S24 family peptidase [Sphingopyxis sp.]|uniref:S24 family peptidase n=1 Tax=Sphingopyxis sp. TaxID=1908224 RepID=UPI002B547C98|nr:S24 family peptidase [Sphingopyxis sp.]HWW56380.1 S24 family peptidase [Sphingopyxis sp.]
MSTEAAIDILRVRLESAMKHRGASAKGLARTAGLGETVVRDILQGMTKDVKLGTIEKLAAALGMSLSDLLPDALGRARPVQGTPSDHAPLISAHAGDGAIALRHVDISYAMGAGSNFDDYPDEMPVLFDPGFLRSLTQAPPEMLFVAEGDGDSMFPTMINGDQVIIDRTQRHLTMQDRIWALSVHGAAMIKRLRTVGPNRVRIMSDNTTIPPEEVDADDVFIAGRVVWIGRKV